MKKNSIFLLLTTTLCLAFSANAALISGKKSPRGQVMKALHANPEIKSAVEWGNKRELFVGVEADGRGKNNYATYVCHLLRENDVEIPYVEIHIMDRNKWLLENKREIITSHKCWLTK